MILVSIKAPVVGFIGLYRGYIGIMEKKIETTVGFRVLGV